MIGSLYFAVCAIVALSGAITVVAARSPIRCAVGLLATILGIAGLFLKLDAQFLAAIQVIVYAGAVVVLFVFVIMLLGPDGGSSPGEARAWLASRIGSSLAVVLAAAGIFLLLPDEPAGPMQPVNPQFGSVEAVGGQIFTDALVPFELATALLIVAVIGAVSVARGRSRVKRAEGKIENPTERLFGGAVHPRDAVQPLAKEESR
jgi:NADH-quinone oxidoreductase subunit J